MIKSMTGFGRYEWPDGNQTITAEIKSVNHRYLDLNIKLPRKLNFMETRIRKLFKNRIQRGKTDVFLLIEDNRENRKKLSYNHGLAEEYFTHITNMTGQFGIIRELSAAELAKCPEVLTMEEESPDEGELWGGLEQALSAAFEQFDATRLMEGENLKRDMLEKLDHMLGCLDQIEARQPQILENYRAKLMAKVEELLANVQIEESRLATEIVLFADKIGTDEETVRLKSHVSAVKSSLDAGGSVGRKLDFIAQEMNREANTILSKANDLETSDLAIELKTDIEKLREQIQNIE